MMEHKLLVISGPTAVGKTAVAIALANYFGTEIISADSRQIFKEMSIGTAKPSLLERAAAKHHFIDSHSIHHPYDAATYGREALQLVHQLFTHHQHAIVCGGSGLYIKALIEGFDDIPEVAESIRQDLITGYTAHGITWLQEQLKQLDAALYNTIDIKNPHRLMRALEVKIGTGQSIAFFRKKSKLQHPFTIIKIGIELPRVELYARIDARIDIMLSEGLLEEARALHPFATHQALQTVGYQELFPFFEGQYDEAEAIRLMKRNSRRYAKRQLTWFKRDPEITWFEPHQKPDMINFINSVQVNRHA